MPRNVKTIEIDGKKLREIFKERALSLSEVSVALGLEESYFSKQTNKGRISLLVAVALETRFGIPRNLYEIVQEIKSEPKKDEVLVTHDFELNKEVAQQLYRIIYSATYEAMRKALES